MSTPQIYLVEPYNAYTAQQGGRKKHWHEIVEEQALMERIIAEQMALQALQEAQSRTLPPNSPPTSVATVGNSNGVAGGAGGTPVWDYWAGGSEVVNFSGTPLTGNGPLTVVFTNLTPTPQFDTYLWKFGDGTTSTDVNPTHVYQSGSTAVGYTVQLTASHDVGSPVSAGKVAYISASIPRVVASSSYVTSSGPGPITATFTNLTLNTSQTPTTTYLWLFGDLTSSSLATPASHTYANTGSFTASLQATGSYGIASKYTQSFYVLAPTLTAAFTVTTSSATGPTTASFVTASGMYNGSGTINGTSAWNFGDGTTGSYSSTTTHIYTNTGSYTASLAVTESSYGITARYTQSFYVLKPVLTTTLTLVTSSKTAPSVATFTNLPSYNGNGTLTYLWNLGSGSLTSSTVIPNPTTYTVAGPYTASLQITESSYNITTTAAVSWRIA